MRIHHFSTHDIEGGAAKAAHRLHLALRRAGQDSQLIVRYKKSEDEAVTQLPLWSRPWRSRLERWRGHIPGLRPRVVVSDYQFNFDRPPHLDLSRLLAGRLLPAPADIIYLHWFDGLLDVRSIRRLYEQWRAPLLWVIHDLEAFTGGCHYSFGCDGFTKQCGACPRLGSRAPDDLSHQIWQRKRDHLARLPICFIAPTSWCVARLRESSLFGRARVEHIHLPMDTSIFRPLAKELAREVLQLPPDQKIVFFGATYLEDRRKGLAQLLVALEHLAALLAQSGVVKPEQLLLLVAGLQGERLMARLPFAGRYLGHVNDELLMALAYQAADIFVCPSIEDAGPMMIPEAMLCGTPVVAFAQGGAPDLIETMKTGYLARLGDAGDLARGLHALLNAPDLAPIGAAAAAAAQRAHTPASVAQRHLQLYASLKSV